MTLITSPPFKKPRRSDPCFCGSQLKFKSCCGDLSENRRIPHGIDIIEKFLTADECSELVKVADGSPKYWLDVEVDDSTTGEKAQLKNKKIRNTRGVRLGKHAKLFEDHFWRAWTQTVPDTVGKTIEHYEPFEMLCYSAGGFYVTHGDAERYSPEKKLWERTFDRDLSMLFYINDNFTGGQLHFPNFDYAYQPKAGDLVIFPSDHRYIHQAQPVISGRRYALVSWAAVKGGPRSFSQAREGVIFTDDKPVVAVAPADAKKVSWLNRVKNKILGNPDNPDNPDNNNSSR